MGNKCFNCNEPAKKNVQKVWIGWDYDNKSGSYSVEHELILDFGPDDDENLHLCEKCYELWRIGEI